MAAHDEMDLSSSLIKQLEKISLSTVRRILKHLDRDKPRLTRKGTKETTRFVTPRPACPFSTDLQAGAATLSKIKAHLGKKQRLEMQDGTQSNIEDSAVPTRPRT